MPEDKRSITFDEKEKVVTVVLNPRLYPQSVIMRAAYRFTEDFDVIVDGDPLDKITAVIKVKDEDKKGTSPADLEKLADAFYGELLHASVEETQARRYADTRNALIGAAISNLASQELLSNVMKNASQNGIQKKHAALPEKSAFERVYRYMPKLNCKRCGHDCETTARKIASKECTPDACVHLKKPEFSVVREELERTLLDLQAGAENHGTGKK